MQAINDRKGLESPKSRSFQGFDHSFDHETEALSSKLIPVSEENMQKRQKRSVSTIIINRRWESIYPGFITQQVFCRISLEIIVNGDDAYNMACLVRKKVSI